MPSIGRSIDLSRENRDDDLPISRQSHAILKWDHTRFALFQTDDRDHPIDVQPRRDAMRVRYGRRPAPGQPLLGKIACQAVPAQPVNNLIILSDLASALMSDLASDLTSDHSSVFCPPSVLSRSYPFRLAGVFHATTGVLRASVTAAPCSPSPRFPRFDHVFRPHRTRGQRFVAVLLHRQNTHRNAG